jgi:AcrR family transcriptional regulator
MLESATELFLRDGYDQTSIDAILERSGGSKATLYSYFPTKEDLFRAVVDGMLSGRGKEARIDEHGDVRRTLTVFAVQRLNVIFSAHHRALLRLIIAERERFPDLAQLYYSRGPQRGLTVLIEYLKELKAAGRVKFDDPEETADFFVGMLMHKWYKELLLIGVPTPSDGEIVRRAERVVDRLLEGRDFDGG